MMYAVGTRIDLGYLNENVARTNKKSQPEEAGRLFIVGTQIMFEWVENHVRANIKIPVLFV